MSNTFFSPGEQRAARVKDLFATIAPRYDLVNDLQSFCLHRVWKGKLAGLAAVKPGDKALDLCCGTGDIALSLAKRGAQVFGLDFSEEMLKIAAGKNRTATTQTPQYFQGDAQRIPFESGAFDIVTVGYGLRNLASWESGLSEMQRVAKSEARLLVLDFGKPDNGIWRAIYFGYLKVFTPLLGKAFCGNAEAYRYILESLKHYPAQNGIADKMREIGLRNVRIINFLGGMMTVNYAEKS